MMTRAKVPWRAIVRAAVVAALAGSPAAGAGLPPGQFFASRVVEYSPGTGHEWYPDPTLALGGPRGTGWMAGGQDVVSLGVQGRLVLGFQPGQALRDGQGVDLIVFENAFAVGALRFAELVRVGVSTDGLEYAFFPVWCGLAGPVGPYQPIDPAKVDGFAGVEPVLANVEGNGLDPFDPAEAGGDAFDLAELAGHPLVLAGTVDLSRIYYVKLVDVLGDGTERDDWDNPIYDPTGSMSGADPYQTSADIDAIAVVHGLPVPLLGDANRDGRVGIADLAIVADNYGSRAGMTWEDGDFNGDGAVGIADLGALADNYGSSTGGAGAPVPEPAVLPLWLSASAWLWGARRRQRRSAA